MKGLPSEGKFASDLIPKRLLTNTCLDIALTYSPYSTLMGIGLRLLRVKGY